jgi:hypothetical protein
LEREVPSAGRIWLRELETERLVEVDTRSGAVRAAWSREHELRTAALAEKLTRVGVDLLELTTDGNLSVALADPLAKYFQLRRRRQARPA